MKNVSGEAIRNLEPPSWVLERLRRYGMAGLSSGGARRLSCFFFMYEAFPVPAQERQETFAERDYIGFIKSSATR
jgi:hypothetical protein